MTPRSSFEQTMISWSPRCYMPSFVEIGLLVLEKIFEGFLSSIYLNVRVHLCTYLCAVCIKNGALRHLSLVMRKPACCIYENKDADQLRSNCADDQRLCLRYTDSKSLYYQPSSVAAQPGLCRTWSETPKTGFLTTRLI